VETAESLAVAVQREAFAVHGRQQRVRGEHSRGFADRFGLFGILLNAGIARQEEHRD